jgi:4-hydroxy-tetrahydrodipicolinate reductase
MTTTIAIAGARGRMGQACQRLVAEDPSWVLRAAWGRGEVPDYSADVLVDFSTPDALLQTADHIEQAWVVGVTGLSAVHHAALADAARRAAVVQSGNFSLGVNLMLGLIADAAKALPDFDLAIADVHHIHKKDSPSGTALMLHKALADARPGADIPIESRREGEVVGLHTVTLQGAEERLTICHEAQDRTLFARGALVAAKWAVGKPAGLYTMRDVLFGRG